MKSIEERTENIQDEIFSKIALLILSNLEKYSPEKIANEINSKSDGHYFVVPTHEGVRYVSKLINKKSK